MKGTLYAIQGQYLTPERKNQCTTVAAVLSSILLVILVSTLPLRAQPTGPTQPFSWEGDKQHQITLPNGEEVIDLAGNVRIQQGLVTITANSGKFYPQQQRATVSGNVRIVQPGTVLTAPQADYNGNTGLATAPAGVTVEEEGGTLTAGFGEYNINRRISFFRNNVTLRDSNTVLTANEGVYYSTERKAIFEGNVSAVSDSGNLTSNQLTYWRGTEQSYAVGNVRLFSLSDSSLLTCDTLDHRPRLETFARGHVVLTSTKEAAILTGDSLRHLPQEFYTVVTGSPRLTQIDSTLRLIYPSDSTAEGEADDTLTGKPLPPDSLAVRLDTIRRGDSIFTLRRDTTTITAHKLERFTKERKEFTATGQARIRRETLEAAAEIARFFEEEEIVALGPGETAATSPPNSTSDSVATDTTDVVEEPVYPSGPEGPLEPESPSDPVAGEPPPPFNGPIVWYDKSQLTGDTITVYLQEKKLQTIDVEGNSFALSTSDAPERYDQLAAERLIFNVRQDTIRSVHANGAAASIYFLYENTAPNGLNRSSGDTIVISFIDGKASRVGIYGPRTRLEGEVIPEKDVSGREAVYRLSGFNKHPRASEVAEEKNATEEEVNPNGPAPQTQRPEGLEQG